MDSLYEMSLSEIQVPNLISEPLSRARSDATEPPLISRLRLVKSVVLSRSAVCVRAENMESWLFLLETLRVSSNYKGYPVV